MVTITKLPLDIEGKLQSNLIVGESHNPVKAQGKANRVIVPEFGAFFTEDVEVRDAKGVIVNRHNGMELTYHYELFSELSGKGVSALIVITDQTRQAPFKITYRAVGGSFSLSVKELADVIEFAENSPVKIKWDDIIDKPTAYIPSPHFNKYWQLYGLDSLVDALRRLADAWAFGTKAIIEANKGYYDDYLDEANRVLIAYDNRVKAHIGDRTNPHKTNKTKIGLSEINNWPLANNVQMVDINNTSTYQPLGAIFKMLETYADPKLDAHVRDMAAVGKPDPHKVSLATLGLYSSAEIENVFSNRLKLTDYAADTTLLAGVTYRQLYDDMRSNLATSNVDPTTRFSLNQLAPWDGTLDANLYMLTGDKRYVLIEDTIKKYIGQDSGIYFAGNVAGGGENINGARRAIENFNWVKPGSWVIGNFTRYLGGWVPMPQMLLARRTEVGTWDYVNYQPEWK